METTTTTTINTTTIGYGIVPTFTGYTVIRIIVCGGRRESYPVETYRARADALRAIARWNTYGDGWLGARL